jgi:hypothetical protein
LAGRFGPALDDLIEAQVVRAEGRVVEERVDEEARGHRAGDG